MGYRHDVGDHERRPVMIGTAGSSQTGTEAQSRKIAYARALLAHGREELRFADAKAASTFAITGTAAGIAAGAAIALSWNPAQQSLPAAALAWVTIGAVVVSLLLTGAAIYPRTRPGVARSGRGVTYFGDVARCDDISALHLALDFSATEEYALLTEELLTVSRIAANKYRLIGASQWALLAGVLAGGGAVAVSIWI
jgi:Family of unknown function (DUF5706)